MAIVVQCVRHLLIKSFRYEETEGERKWQLLQVDE